MSDYDCTNDVNKHRAEVANILIKFAKEIEFRALHHDVSKLEDPIEKALFDQWTPKLRRLIFGTDEYKMALDAMGEGIKHHYQHNRHHPEHFENGIMGMTLVDIMEMVADWMAVAARNNIEVDLFHAVKRFGLSEQLVQIIINTIKEEK